MHLPKIGPGQRLRWLGKGLATVLGVSRQGFFCPHAHAGRIPASQPEYQAVGGALHRAEAAFANLLAAMDAVADALLTIDGPPPAPRWRQGWFAGLDGAAAYVLMRQSRPRRVIEIGSGHSTRFLIRGLADGRLADGGAETVFTAIDPAPRAALAGLPVRHLNHRVQETPLEAFAALAAGDVLFVDSSHLAMPGTDLDWLVGRVLPGLPAGVLVHLHDVLLPDDYPAAWRLRGYNESVVAAALIAGGFRPIWASHYIATRMADRVQAGVSGRIPRDPRVPETSLWLEKTVPAAGSLTYG